jgi:hypothetical protein
VLTAARGHPGRVRTSSDRSARCDASVWITSSCSSSSTCSASSVGIFDYYGRWRCHLSLEGDAPEPRPVHPPRLGRVVELPELGDLHHRYVRKAA